MKTLFSAVSHVVGLVVFSLMFLGVCATLSSPNSAPAPLLHAGQPAVVMQTLDPTLEPYAVLWQKEIARRFPYALGILVHGGDFVEGQWIVEGNYASGEHVLPVASVVAHYKALYPGRTVVLLACNTGHLKLGVPGVYYATSSVWCVPDRNVPEVTITSAEVRRTLEKTHPATQPATKPSFSPLLQTQIRSDDNPDYVGNIFEFVAE